MSRRPSPLDNEQCRQCSSFSDYVKSATKKVQDENSKNDSSSTSAKDLDEMKPRREDCPLNRETLGNKSWGLLHTMAAKYPSTPTDDQKNEMKEFFRILSNVYPCPLCAGDLREELKCNPPQVESQQVFSQWLCKLHNKINVKIGKEVFDCSKVNERWRDGWADGSCDY